MVTDRQRTTHSGVIFFSVLAEPCTKICAEAHGKPQFSAKAIDRLGGGAKERTRWRSGGQPPRTPGLGIEGSDDACGEVAVKAHRDAMLEPGLGKRLGTEIACIEHSEIAAVGRRVVDYV
jgi:hypothetical protein